MAIELPAEGLRIELTPTLRDQELDTRESTGVIYWEGSQVVTASRNGQPRRRRGLCRADRVRTVGRRPVTVGQRAGLAGIVIRLAAASASIAVRVAWIEPSSLTIRFVDALYLALLPRETLRASRAVWRTDR